MKDYGRCPDCAGVRLVFVSQDFEAGHAFWCPRCESRWRFMEAKPPLTQDRQPLRTDIRYEGRLFPDASISWTASFTRISLVEARVVWMALAHLKAEASDLEEHIRGADRFVFVKDGSGWVAMYKDSDRQLVAYTVGKPRREHHRPLACASCNHPMVAGTKGYKAVPRTGSGYFSWSLIRLCAVCVETPRPIAALGPLVPAPRG